MSQGTTDSKETESGAGCLIFIGLVLAAVGATVVWGGMGLFVSGIGIIVLTLILLGLAK